MALVMTLLGTSEAVIVLFKNILQLSRIRAFQAHEESLFSSFSCMEKLCGFSGCLCRSPSVVGSVEVEKVTHKNLCAASTSHPAYKTLQGLKPCINKPVKPAFIINNL